MRWIILSLSLVASAALAADAPLRPEQMREAMKLKLGEWQTVSTLVELAVEPGPGDDPAEADRAAAAIRTQTARPLTQEQCLWDDRTRLSLPGVRAPGNCDYSRLEARDGKFTVAALCRYPGSTAVIEVAMEGTYTPERMTYRSEATVSAGKGQIRMKMNMASRYRGKCSLPPVILTPPQKGN